VSWGAKVFAGTSALGSYTSLAGGLWATSRMVESLLQIMIVGM
jgi:hypothetical protein